MNLANTTENLNKLIASLNNGEIDFSYLKVLFVDIREEKGLPGRIREIGDFIAHSNKERGHVFNLAEKFVDNILKLTNGNGGVLRTLPPIFNQNELAKDLDTFLKRLGLISKDDFILINNSYLIMKGTIQILAGCSLKIRDPRIIKCELEIFNENTIKLQLSIYPIQTANTTSIGGRGGFLFGPHLSIKTEILQAIPIFINDKKNGSITISIDKSKKWLN